MTDDLDEVVAELYADACLAAEDYESRAEWFLAWWEGAYWHVNWRPIGYDDPELEEEEE